MRLYQNMTTIILCTALDYACICRPRLCLHMQPSQGRPFSGMTADDDVTVAVQCATYFAQPGEMEVPGSNVLHFKSPWG